MSRKHREHLATCAILWRPIEGPQVPDEASDKRAEALRKWRGQDEADEDEDQSPRKTPEL